jgi:glutathione reductase (NADPH)
MSAAWLRTKKNINLHFDSNLEKVEKLDNGKLQVTFKEPIKLSEDGARSSSCEEFDVVLYATGRVPAVNDLGLENVDVKCRENGAIIVDDYYQTSVPSIYALGDVIDKVQLTPVAIEEAMTFVKTQYLNVPTKMDYDNIATAVFCQPNIGTVGLTEAEARSKFGDIAVYKSTYRAMKHTLSGSDEKNMMKLIVDRKSDVVVGVHMVGPEAGEIIQGIAIALKAGATKAVFDSTVGIHPTAAEEFVTMREETNAA